eukprot:m.121248 g.121248  ORF g.121248 m.121248 type:complete len:166 (-) comp14385_c0_seq4:21-518(-)
MLPRCILCSLSWADCKLRFWMLASITLLFSFQVLHGALVYSCSSIVPVDPNSPTPFGFAIVRDNFNSVFFFSAPSAQERDLWIMSLTAHTYDKSLLTLQQPDLSSITAMLPKDAPVPPPRRKRVTTTANTNASESRRNNPFLSPPAAKQRSATTVARGNPFLNKK